MGLDQYAIARRGEKLTDAEGYEYYNDNIELAYWRKHPNLQGWMESLWHVKGNNGEFYNIGSNKNLNNLQVTNELLKKSKKLIKLGSKVKINFVKDRPGHDIRYALNSNKIRNKIGWYPRVNFSKGIRLTLEWYFENKSYYKSLSKKDIINRLGKK